MTYFLLFCAAIRAASLRFLALNPRLEGTGELKLDCYDDVEGLVYAHGVPSGPFFAFAFAGRFAFGVDASLSGNCRLEDDEDCGGEGAG